MKPLLICVAIMLLAGCTRYAEHSFIRSPWDNEVLRIAHEPCGAPCDQRDIVTLGRISYGGKWDEAELADIGGATKLDIGWPSRGRIIIGACNAASAKIHSDLERIDPVHRNIATTDIVLTTVELSINGKTYCRGFGTYSAG